jgi:hypothetical protein
MVDPKLKFWVGVENAHQHIVEKLTFLIKKLQNAYTATMPHRALKTIVQHFGPHNNIRTPIARS